MRTRVAAFVACVVLAGACSGDTTATTAPSTIAPSTTTTLTIPDRVETSTTVDPGAADPDTTQRLTSAIESLVAEAQIVRGLIFIETPRVLVLEPAAFADRLARRHEEVLATAGPTGKSSFYQLAQLLRFETAEAILGRLDPPATSVFFDPEGFRIVVSGDADERDPVMRTAAMHELILALTDQHHRTTEIRSALVAAGADDRLRAFDALVEGDATYFQLVYIQGMTPEEQVLVAAAFDATATPVVSGIPTFLRKDLAFPYEAGVTFVGELVGAAGIAGVDQAYRDPPESSEHILHPERYRRGEAVVAVPPLEIALDGATSSTSATFGEQQLDHLLSLSMQAGMVTQAVDGWQGDQYQLVETDDGAAFALTLVMESDEDAIEVVGGLIAHARDVLEAGEGVEAAGGLLWEEGPAYVFLDRVGDALMYVLATDRDLGRAVRSQVSVP